jgi:hypothetical protein
MTILAGKNPVRRSTRLLIGHVRVQFHNLLIDVT